MGKWKEFGGDAIIHLPDKSDIVVPPHAVPRGTCVKVEECVTEAVGDANP